MNKVVLNKDAFSRLFVLCKNNKVNMLSFSLSLAKHDEMSLSEEETNLVSIVDLFNEITGLYIEEDDSFGLYNDAYWCGTVYFYLIQKSNKPLAYILWKFPFNELIDCYSTYHEMDYSSIYEVFLKKEKERAILKLLCSQNSISLNKVSKATQININSLERYSMSDEKLYSASFQTIYKLAHYFDVSMSLFSEKLL